MTLFGYPYNNDLGICKAVKYKDQDDLGICKDSPDYLAPCYLAVDCPVTLTL